MNIEPARILLPCADCRDHGPHNFFDPRTDSGSVAHEKLTWTYIWILLLLFSGDYFIILLITAL